MDYGKLGIDPITADAPAGSDARYESEFEELQTEIDKLSSPTASGGVNWKKVGDLSAQILAEKSKDLLVASYFAVSQVRAEKAVGLAVGLTVMHDLVANFWDQLFPAKKRMRGRLSAFEWWLEKTMSMLDDQNVPPIAAEAQEAMISNLDGLDALLEEHMPEPPMLIKLKRYIQSLPSEAPKSPAPEAAPPSEPEPPSVETAETEEQKTPIPSRPSPPPEPPKEEMDAGVLISGGLKYLNKAIDILNEADWSDARAYRIRRQAAWINLDGLPADTEGKTMIPAPPPATVQALGNMRDQGAWADLLKAAEASLSQLIFWQDLNRMVAEALVGLGSDYQTAHDTVCLETAYFVHRFPGITQLTFANRMPFADADTIAWLKDIAFGAGAAMEAPISTAGSDAEKGRMTEIIQEAQNLAKKKKIKEAVGLVQTEMQSAVAHKEVMLWRMALCQIMVAAKQVPLALPQLELIVESIDRFQLETWDPELALQGLKIAWQGYKAQNNQDDQDKAAAVLNRINRLNPVAAMGLK